MKEHAYDVMIRAVVRVNAENEEDGRLRIRNNIETITPEELVNTIGEHHVEITEMSTWNMPCLFEVDGVTREPAKPFALVSDNLKRAMSELIRQHGPAHTLLAFQEEALRYRMTVRSAIADSVSDGLVEAIRHVAHKAVV